MADLQNVAATHGAPWLQVRSAMQHRDAIKLLHWPCLADGLCSGHAFWPDPKQDSEQPIYGHVIRVLGGLKVVHKV